MHFNLRTRKLLTALPIERLLSRWGELSGYETNAVMGDEADFSEYKAYVFGDEVRRIDWKVYARRERLFVKKFASERARSTLVVLDASASMAEGLHGAPVKTAADSAAHKLAPKSTGGMATVLRYLFHYLYIKQEPYAVAVMRGGKRDFYKMQNGSKQLRLMETLLTQLEARGTNLAIPELIDTIRSGGEFKNMLFFSDFQMEPRTLIPLIRATSRKQLALSCISYFNPRLLNIRFISGLRWIKDSETGSFAVMNQRDMKKYRKLILEHYEAIARLLRARGVRYQQLDFREQDSFKSFTTLFQS